MILPNKNTNLSNSILGIGATLIPLLRVPCTVSDLWTQSKHHPKQTISFEKFILALDLLFLLGLIKFESGLIKKK